MRRRVWSLTWWWLSYSVSAHWVVDHNTGLDTHVWPGTAWTNTRLPTTKDWNKDRFGPKTVRNKKLQFSPTTERTEFRLTSKWTQHTFSDTEYTNQRSSSHSLKTTWTTLKENRNSHYNANEHSPPNAVSKTKLSQSSGSRWHEEADQRVNRKNLSDNGTDNFLTTTRGRTKNNNFKTHTGELSLFLEDKTSDHYPQNSLYPNSTEELLNVNIQRRGRDVYKVPGIYGKDVILRRGNNINKI